MKPFLSQLCRVLSVCILTFAALLAAAANQRVYDYRLGQADLGAGPPRPLGSLAPDFTLPQLLSYIARKGAPPVATTTLSSFRGKKVVVLIMTGYT